MQPNMRANWSILSHMQNVNPVECDGDTQDPSDDFTECIGEFHYLQPLVNGQSTILILINYTYTTFIL